MTKIDTIGIPRPVRVTFPVKVAFEGETFQIEEFTANLSVGGLFLPTDRAVPPRTQGTLTFRVCQWEEPFTVRAEVVRSVSPGGDAQQHPPGLGIMFIDLADPDRRRLARLVEGVRDGSVAQTIRREIREANGNLGQELRRRSADQKVIFAVSANGEEINALIRDANPAVVQRLLDNPRLNTRHLCMILRNPRTSTKIMLTIRRTRKWLVEGEIVALFCAHPNAPVEGLPQVMKRLSRTRLATLERNPSLRAPVRAMAKQLLGTGQLRSL